MPCGRRPRLESRQSFTELVSSNLTLSANLAAQEQPPKRYSLPHSKLAERYKP